MNQKEEAAKKLYLEGIRDGDMGAIHKYTGARYTQHNKSVRDGQEGFLEFFEGFVARNPDRDIQIIRSFVDENYVFLNAYQELNKGQENHSRWVTMDIFDTDDNDKLIEHWDVIIPYIDKENTTSGNDLILGDFEPKDLDKTEDNKALVRSFFVDVFQNKNYQNIENYISVEQYIQHNPQLPNGIEPIKQFLATEDFQYDFIFKVIGYGNYVASYSKAILNKKEFAVMDLFRIEEGKIVEHWDVIEAIEPREQWVNSGKF